MRFPERVPLAHLPTPLHKLARLSEELGGPEIYLKRDDLTGIVETGNKIRKLEFLLAEAQQQGCQVLITCGGAQSNHARATAVAAARSRLKCHLVLRDSIGSEFDGNLLLDRLVGAEIKFITPQEYEQVDDIMARLAETYVAQGLKPYVIPEGGSNALGSLGYVIAMQEMAEQAAAQGLHFDHLVCAVGSGGTLAGMLLGRHLYGLAGQVHGINVCDDARYFQNRVSNILRSARRKFGFKLNLQSQDISIIDGYVGKGYGLSRQEEIDLIKHVAQCEGIILDPVYTGKAMFGLVDQIRQGRFQAGEKILFWHTGGIFGLFPKKALFF
ncbi:MAG: D-cysteine desulfhydrase family protein [candidate division KSB1 bacterium]|nr:D-cysteine desulfhydrase family protein [candidate division KSB1 bacterium]MDZ7273715.1 D-cysteine desulfhydrase family protein [candidate division KSB1 bacterium]MDZ7285871.1 D-cysteine desulfhydrase family protein [candidate division KSB1 bacterium]MDZ7298903.1 D-cysteine desulfhydrase family protein [candidate division KSB1 bacterium]MDZ7309469.1 D-cysteine desulfhydrase family protein [candidate division KSB1 bacterium]